MFNFPGFVQNLRDLKQDFAFCMEFAKAGSDKPICFTWPVRASDGDRQRAANDESCRNTTCARLFRTPITSALRQSLFIEKDTTINKGGSRDYNVLSTLVSWQVCICSEKGWSLERVTGMCLSQNLKNSRLQSCAPGVLPWVFERGGVGWTCLHACVWSRCFLQNVTSDTGSLTLFSWYVESLCANTLSDSVVLADKRPAHVMRDSSLLQREQVLKLWPRYLSFIDISAFKHFCSVKDDSYLHRNVKSLWFLSRK